MRNVYVLHLVMFLGCFARWNFNGVLMANARVCRVYATAVGNRERRNGKEEGRSSRRRKKNWEQTKKGATKERENPRDGPHVSLPRSSECIYWSVDFKFFPETIFYS